MELVGKVCQLLPERTGTGKSGAWVKNYFVIEYQDGGYLSRLCLEVMGSEKWEKMRTAVVVGNQVQVKFGVSSHEWQGRWFTSAACYYCAAVSGLGGGSANTAAGGGVSQGDGDTVPF